jgi:2-C-methyl-D-erythritol 4-phosphate cytidylyltransferase
MNVAIIAAAGIGRRMGSGGKQYLPLRGEPVLAHALRAFQACFEVYQIIIVSAEVDIDRCRDLVKKYDFGKVTQIIKGGEERQDSVFNALQVVPKQAEIVVVHDGARPLVTPEIIKRSLDELEGWDGVIVGVPAKDTLKLVEAQAVVETLDRERIWQVQTPQVFRADLLTEAYRAAITKGYYGTDDAALMEQLGYKIKVTMGSYENIKITTPEDLVIAEAILAQRAET